VQQGHDGDHLQGLFWKIRPTSIKAVKIDLKCSRCET
jgi:hypothetical protein